jgi:hypothetical protein
MLGPRSSTHGALGLTWWGVFCEQRDQRLKREHVEMLNKVLWKCTNKVSESWTCTNKVSRVVQVYE